MPIYEYFCSDCKRKVEVFRRSIAATSPLGCPSCGGSGLSRLVSRFAVHRSAGEFGSADEERYLEGLDEGDPQAMAAWARRMGHETGEDADPEFQQMLSQIEAGELPGDGSGSAGDDDFGDLSG